MPVDIIFVFSSYISGTVKLLGLTFIFITGLSISFEEVVPEVEIVLIFSSRCHFLYFSK